MLRFVFCLFLTLVFTPPVPAGDWPQLHGPARDGHAAETKLNWDWPKMGIPLVWKVDVGSGWAGPVVSGDNLILFHRVDDEEVIACFNPVTGKEKWKVAYRTKYRDDFDFDNGPRATPTIVDGTVFALGANGDLTAVELATGKKVWARNLVDDYKPAKGFFGVACSPLVTQKKVFVNVGAKGAGIVCFNAADGKEIWKSTDDGASYSSPTTAEIDGQPAAVFLTRAGLRVLDPTTGKSLYDFAWRPRDNNSVQAATPVVWKDEIFLTVSYATGAVLLKTQKGEVTDVWSSDKSLSSQYNTSVRVGDYLYGTHGRSDVGNAQMRCIEWKTGEVKWSEAKFGVASLIAVDGGLLALNENGELVRFAASPDGYKEHARSPLLTKPTRPAPALANGLFYARDGKTLVCVSLKK
ncbi:outer membrane biogenesis protein BamB [Gemmata sp. SH-PL17]|uniref:PQQ-binding-like beta-propeller repeat protein n=1 Tax=Gemmata sp. SH-PL17 TaxID=1630693 RepID=UPI00078E79AD|nr:PQQ-binding-like beta-propeller repeat protein [Gemmata sp. SH-PL17]AMV23194.1 outer membrane biogenesis protein BamB [Gemmata sp. SH-PL17]